MFRLAPTSLAPLTVLHGGNFRPIKAAGVAGGVLRAPGADLYGQGDAASSVSRWRVNSMVWVRPGRGRRLCPLCLCAAAR